MGIGDRLRRWRASLGYGVHSPLAYRLVRHVVRPERGVVYYGEELLERSPEWKAEGIERRRARLLLRLVAELQPSYVWTSPGLPAIYKEAIRLAGCVIRVFDGKLFPGEMASADMIVTVGTKLRQKDLAKAAGAGKAIAAFGVSSSFIARLKSNPGGGVLLDGVASVVAVGTSDPQKHIYELSRF